MPVTCMQKATLSLRPCFVYAGTRTIILIHGNHLNRTDLTLEFRLSPDIGRPLGPVSKVSEHLLGEWHVPNLLKPKVSDAPR